jgi:tetratricopeptide (TPR) repeat protein
VIALNNLAWILAPRTEAAEEAMKCVDRAIEISGPTGELLDTRARIHIARGNYDRAIEDLNQALQQGQTSLRWFHLAIAQFKQLKKEESLKSFKEARARGIDARMVHPDDLPMYKVMASQME